MPLRLAHALPRGEVPEAAERAGWVEARCQGGVRAGNVAHGAANICGLPSRLGNSPAFIFMLLNQMQAALHQAGTIALLPPHAGTPLRAATVRLTEWWCRSCRWP